MISESVRTQIDSVIESSQKLISGEHQTFGEYVVVKCEGLPVGTQTWSGKLLDYVLDQMEAADAKP